MSHAQQNPHSNSKYNRPRFFLSWFGLILGLLIGMSAALYATWVLFPIVETDTRPDQLQTSDRAHYAVAIALAYAYDGDLAQVIERLSDLDLGGDPIQGMADVACELARSGYMNSSAGLRGVRALQTFYRLQGKSSCADSILPDMQDSQVIEVNVPTETPTLPPPPTKTPSADNASPTPSGIVFAPTSPPSRSFEGAVFDTFCDVELSGIIEVYVQADGSRDGLGGEVLRVRWEGGESRFVTGLKPERGAGYADFRMVAGQSYTITMPQRSDPISTTLIAQPCFTESGDEALTSYRVSFIRIGG